MLKRMQRMTINRYPPKAQYLVKRDIKVVYDAGCG